MALCLDCLLKCENMETIWIVLATLKSMRQDSPITLSIRQVGQRIMTIIMTSVDSKSALSERVGRHRARKKSLQHYRYNCNRFRHNFVFLTKTSVILQCTEKNRKFCTMFRHRYGSWQYLTLSVMLLSFDKSFAKGKRCTASQLLKEFANNRNWSRGGLNHFLQKNDL